MLFLRYQFFLLFCCFLLSLPVYFSSVLLPCHCSLTTPSPLPSSELRALRQTCLQTEWQLMKDPQPPTFLPLLPVFSYSALHSTLTCLNITEEAAAQNKLCSQMIPCINTSLHPKHIFTLIENKPQIDIDILFVSRLFIWHILLNHMILVRNQNPLQKTWSQ